MAKIVFGVGCSHSPLLATKPEQWDLRANDDRKNPAHPYRGKVYTFTELEELRKNENLAEQIRMEVRRERDARNQKNLALLSDKIAAAEPRRAGGVRRRPARGAAERQHAGLHGLHRQGRAVQADVGGASRRR